jgi:ABC-type Fe3+-hydroxamate transport system substrate-binding protein
MGFLNQHILEGIPKRIISLVPSQTELLYDLGLEEAVVGITKFCVHPKQWHQQKASVGGTKTVNLEAIRALQPDLIIANKEENVKEQIEALVDEAPVWVTDVGDLQSALQMIRDIARLTNTLDKAELIVDRIKVGFDAITPLATPTKVLYLIWRNPWMSVGSDTFIHNMLQLVGWQNVCTDFQRYPTLLNQEIIQLDPHLVLLSSF